MRPVTFSVHLSMAFPTVPISGSFRNSLSTGWRPAFSRRSIFSPHVGMSSSEYTRLNGTQWILLLFTSSTSFRDREPDARFLGLAKSPSDSMQNCSKSEYDMTASPRMTRWPFAGIVRGMS